MRSNLGRAGRLGGGVQLDVKTNFDGQRKIWASGGTFGQSCYLCFYPERKFGIVILSNESDGGTEDRLSDLAQTVYNERFFTNDQRLAEGFGFSSSINRLLDSLNKKGFENAISVMTEVKKESPTFKLYENELNLWGYYYYFKGQKEKALEIFKLNVNLYPLSANTYDSLAETYEELGDKSNAIKNYEKEIELSPGNKDIEDHLKKLKAR
jgi:D-alanyl-D-alanine-carboxypeptidase/D-alanyl-D-alanine-endopeptidase